MSITLLDELKLYRKTIAMRIAKIDAILEDVSPRSPLRTHFEAERAALSQVLRELTEIIKLYEKDQEEMVE